MKTKRPPIVTVLGHVDHGKTTLLDAIRNLTSSGRKTSVASREAGGITQGIGASQVTTSEGTITFLDTPGHAAFAKMRARGAKLADIAILVVAADDGMMPQTREALNYILEQKIPFIVALTKIDLPSVNIEKALGSLEQEQVFFEGRGGQVPYVEVSAKAGQGIDALLELIHLVSEVSDISTDSESPLLATVIETNKDKKGTIVSVVVKDGVLKVGDEILAGDLSARVKGLFGEDGKNIKEVHPGGAAAVLGFGEIPEVGAQVTLLGKAVKAASRSKAHARVKVGKDQLALVVKAQTAGALEALAEILPEGAVILSSSVGDVTESDVFFAKTSGATIVVFEAKASSQVAKLAEAESVEIATFKIIYELADFVREKIEGAKVATFGKAEILAEFPYNRIRVAGVKILEGHIQKNDTVILMRGEKELGETKVVSMRREKNHIAEAKAGEECGLVIAPQLQFEKGDILVAIKNNHGKVI